MPVTTTPPMPRLPVFGWAALRGRRAPSTPTLLDLPTRHFTTSGRASILLALEALGIGEGDRVWLPTYHCPTMIAPAAALGAQLNFYPIDDRGSPQLAWLRAQDLTRTRAILVAHYFGLPQPLAAMRAWCDEHRIALIEDCAHALFGRSGERPVGAWGDMAIGSLTKFLPVPDGGCLVVNNGASAPRLAACPPKAQLKAGIDVLEDGARHQRLAGFNAAITWPLAMLRGRRAPLSTPAPSDDAAVDQETFGLDVGLAHRALSAPSRWVTSCLPRERIVQRRRRHYERLAQALAGHAGLRPLLPHLPPDCAPYVFPLWVDQPDPGYAELRRLRMPVFRWDRPWPHMPAFAGDHGPPWAHHVLQIGCHQDLGDADIGLLVRTLVDLYGVAAD
jgi:perosamine synthetase